MKKVITYGTFDFLHYGHIRLLKRAKELGDYLIVGITADDFDKIRGKINVQQSLSERIEGVRTTGLADEIIIEEYEGQKIDDIRRFNVDIFAIGSDWNGYFDYLKEYCSVIYLDRTQGISSSEIRKQKRGLLLGLVGNSAYLNKVASEALQVNGITLSGICSTNTSCLSKQIKDLPLITTQYEEIIDCSDAIYVHAVPQKHYELSKKALMAGKHVLCESPLSLRVNECEELYQIAKEHNCLLVESLRTAYATAFDRLVLLVKGDKIGDVVFVDATCTSLKNHSIKNGIDTSSMWNSITAWGPTALLPVFQILGDDYKDMKIISRFIDDEKSFDTFTKIDFVYKNATASIKVGNGMKSEGELIVSGTKGYIYVPAPWWKTDYFEIRFEDPTLNKKYFYQLDGEGLRYELADFVKSIEKNENSFYITEKTSLAIVKVMESFDKKKNMVVI